jgi:hypothetical protein
MVVSLVEVHSDQFSQKVCKANVVKMLKIIFFFQKWVKVVKNNVIYWVTMHFDQNGLKNNFSGIAKFIYSKKSKSGKQYLHPHLQI